MCACNVRQVLRRWINAADNARYSALTFAGGAAWRAALLADTDKFGGGEASTQFRALIESKSDAQLQVIPPHRGGS